MNLQGRNLSMNLLGQDVQLLQSELQQLGFQIPDNELQKSTFGTGTRDAVLEFQKQNGLQAAGIVDDTTAKEINKGVADMNVQRSLAAGLAPATNPASEVAPWADPRRELTSKAPL